MRAFKHLGGVTQRCIYDNLKAAVKRRLGIERELSARFLALCSHYLFEPCFARPGEGHDKVITYLANQTTNSPAETRGRSIAVVILAINSSETVQPIRRAS